jgi:hypothetical protein
VNPPACGTYGGYQRHHRLGETACLACAAANADYQRAVRIASGSQKAVYVPVGTLGLLLAACSPEVRRLVAGEIGPKTVETVQRHARVRR